jgi:hypothetical protein
MHPNEFHWLVLAQLILFALCAWKAHQLYGGQTHEQITQDPIRNAGRLSDRSG